MSRQSKSTEPRKRSNPEKVFVDNKFKTIIAKTEKQKKYLNAIDVHAITFGTGVAGSGKTACAVYKAAEYFHKGLIEKIIISRPAVEAGEHLGALPGELDLKMEPYLAPVRHILNDALGKSHVDLLLKDGTIEIVPLAFCRGRTFNNSFVILDEAQNTTPKQMLMFLTRIGIDSKYVITGDDTQTDIQGINGLQDAVKRLSWHPNMKMINFDTNDIIRSYLISDIIQSYQS